MFSMAEEHMGQILSLKLGQKESRIQQLGNESCAVIEIKSIFSRLPIYFSIISHSLSTVDFCNEDASVKSDMDK
jgi:hypothetical protein